MTDIANLVIQVEQDFQDVIGDSAKAKDALRSVADETKNIERGAKSAADSLTRTQQRMLAYAEKVKKAIDAYDKMKAASRGANLDDGMRLKIDNLGKSVDRAWESVDNYQKAMKNLKGTTLQALSPAANLVGILNKVRDSGVDVKDVMGDIKKNVKEAADTFRIAHNLYRQGLIDDKTYKRVQDAARQIKGLRNSIFTAGSNDPMDAIRKAFDGGAQAAESGTKRMTDAAKTAAKEIRAVFYDIETAVRGDGSTGNIYDLYAREVFIDPEKKKVRRGESMQLFFDPMEDLNRKGIPGLNSMTRNEFVGDKKGQISERLEGMRRFLDFVGDSPVAGHNVVGFDNKQINALIEELNDPELKKKLLPAGTLQKGGHQIELAVGSIDKVIDTLQLARAAYPDFPTTPKGKSGRSLEGLAERFQIKYPGKAHTAHADTEVNVDLMEKMLNDGAKIGEQKQALISHNGLVSRLKETGVNVPDSIDDLQKAKDNIGQITKLAAENKGYFGKIVGDAARLSEIGSGLKTDELTSLFKPIRDGQDQLRSAAERADTLRLSLVKLKDDALKSGMVDKLALPIRNIDSWVKQLDDATGHYRTQVDSIDRHLDTATSKAMAARRESELAGKAAASAAAVPPAGSGVGGGGRGGVPPRSPGGTGGGGTGSGGGSGGDDDNNGKRILRFRQLVREAQKEFGSLPDAVSHFDMALSDIDMSRSLGLEPVDQLQKKLKELRMELVQTVTKYGDLLKAGGQAYSQIDLDNIPNNQLKLLREAREELNSQIEAVDKLGRVGKDAQKLDRALGRDAASPGAPPDSAENTNPLAKMLSPEVIEKAKDALSDLKSEMSKTKLAASVEGADHKSLAGQLAQDADRAAASANELRQKLQTLKQQAQDSGRVDDQFSKQYRQASDELARYENQIARARAQSDSLANAHQSSERSVRGLSRSIAEATGQVANMSGHFQGLVGVLASLGLTTVAGAIIRTAIEMDKMEATMLASFGAGKSVSEGMGLVAQEMEYVRGVADRLGQEYAGLTRPYARLAIAAKTAGMETSVMRSIFEATVTTAAALGSSVEETRGIVKAFEQMMSKGKVQAEELRQQLGDRLPGAVNTFAKAYFMVKGQMDENGLVSPDQMAEFEDAMKKGLVRANETLPVVATLLKGNLATAAELMAAKVQAAFARVKNTFSDFSQEIFDAGLEDGLKDIAQSLQNLMGSGMVRDIAFGTAKAFQFLAEVVKNNTEVFVQLGLAVSSLLTISIMARAIEFLTFAFSKWALIIGGVVTGITFLYGWLLKSDDKIKQSAEATKVATTTNTALGTSYIKVADATTTMTDANNDLLQSEADKAGAMERTASAMSLYLAGIVEAKAKSRELSGENEIAVNWFQAMGMALGGLTLVPLATSMLTLVKNTQLAKAAIVQLRAVALTLMLIGPAATAGVAAGGILGGIASVLKQVPALVTTALTALRTIGAMAFRMIGGWPGLIIAGVAGAIGVISSLSDAALDRIKEYEAQIAETNKVLNDGKKTSRDTLEKTLNDTMETRIKIIDDLAAAYARLDKAKQEKLASDKNNGIGSAGAFGSFQEGQDVAKDGWIQHQAEQAQELERQLEATSSQTAQLMSLLTAQPPELFKGMDKDVSAVTLKIAEMKAEIFEALKKYTEFADQFNDAKELRQKAKKIVDDKQEKGVTASPLDLKNIQDADAVMKMLGYTLINDLVPGYADAEVASLNMKVAQEVLTQAMKDLGIKGEEADRIMKALARTFREDLAPATYAVEEGIQDAQIKLATNQALIAAAKRGGEKGLMHEQARQDAVETVRKQVGPDKFSEMNPDDVDALIEPLAAVNLQVAQSDETLRNLQRGWKSTERAGESYAKKMEKAWASLRSEIFPMEDAQRDVAEGQKVVAWALKTGKISADQASEAVRRLKEKYEDIIDPMGAFSKEQERIRDDIDVPGREAKVLKQVTEAEKKLRDKLGRMLTIEEKARVRLEIEITYDAQAIETRAKDIQDEIANKIQKQQYSQYKQMGVNDALVHAAKGAGVLTVGDEDSGNEMRTQLEYIERLKSAFGESAANGNKEAAGLVQTLEYEAETYRKIIQMQEQHRGSIGQTAQVVVQANEQMIEAIKKYGSAQADAYEAQKSQTRVNMYQEWAKSGRALSDSIIEQNQLIVESWKETHKNSSDVLGHWAADVADFLVNMKTIGEEVADLFKDVRETLTESLAGAINGTNSKSLWDTLGDQFNDLTNRWTVKAIDRVTNELMGKGLDLLQAGPFKDMDLKSVLGIKEGWGPDSGAIDKEMLGRTESTAMWVKMVNGKKEGGGGISGDGTMSGGEGSDTMLGGTNADRPVNSDATNDKALSVYNSLPQWNVPYDAATGSMGASSSVMSDGSSIVWNDAAGPLTSAATTAATTAAGQATDEFSGTVSSGFGDLFSFLSNNFGTLLGEIGSGFGGTMSTILGLASQIAMIASMSGGGSGGGIAGLIEKGVGMAVSWMSGGADAGLGAGVADGTTVPGIGGDTTFDFGGGAEFANGGIMTKYGAMNLKTYSNGGIARSPQLAMFGEGKRPEAFVPLPDGRTIPVTMTRLPQQRMAQDTQSNQTGPTNNVSVNVHIANGTPEAARQSGGQIAATVARQLQFSARRNM